MIPLLSLILAPVAGAASLEVSPGDDLNGLIGSLSPGDEIILNNGIYEIDATLTIALEATEDEPVRFRAKNTGEAIIQAAPNAEGAYPGTLLQIDSSAWVSVEGVVLQGDDTWEQTDDPRYYGLIINASSNITVEDVEVHQVNRTAVYLSGENNTIAFRRVHVHDVSAGYGLYVGCSDASCWTSELTIEKSWFHDISGDDAYGLYLAHGTQGAQVTDTVIYNVTRFGLYMGSTERGAENVAEGNAIWSVVDAAIFVEGAARIRNNIIFNVDGRGIWTRDPERGTYGDLVIAYNTVADTTGWAAELDDWQAAEGTLVLSSNALCNPVGYGVQMDLVQVDTALPETPGYVANNVVCGLVEGLDEYAGEIVPGGGFNDFSDAEGWNFYPVSGATLIDAGDPSADGWTPDIDFNGLPRTGAPEAGAYEFDGEGNPGWQVQEGFKTFDLESRSQPQVIGGCCSDSKGDEPSGAALILVPLLTVGAALRRAPRRRDGDDETR